MGRARSGRRGCFWLAAIVWVGIVGCWQPTSTVCQQELSRAKEQLTQREAELTAKQAALDEVQKQLAVARSISEEDLKHLFYPEKLEILGLSGGADYDGKPGDDGVTVYLRPIDRFGDVVKVAGDVRIQLYDLAASAGQNLIGEYAVPVDQMATLWYGKLMTQHFTIKCPWPHGPPAHDEVTVRVVFIDYLTKRVVTAQAVCKVKLPPR